MLNSALCAPVILQTFLANSITAHCMPRHIPKNGILFSLAYFIAFILPCTPREPNPPGTRIPSTSERNSASFFSSISPDSIIFTETLTLLAIPAWLNASYILLYASLRLMYFPTTPIFTSPFLGVMAFSSILFHSVRSRVLIGNLKCSRIYLSRFCLASSIGTS